MTLLARRPCSLVAARGHEACLPLGWIAVNPGARGRRKRGRAVARASRLLTQSPTMDLELTTAQLLSTTRAVRKRMDFNRPVEIEVIRECLELAIQAPTGSNMQGWHFMVVTDPEVRGKIADIYRRAFDIYRKLPVAAGNIHTGDPSRDATQERVMDSAEYLAAHMHEAPVHVIPCITGRVDGGPAIMSA